MLTTTTLIATVFIVGMMVNGDDMSGNGGKDVKN